ncbi:hypothetical protein ABTH13_20550, partial [Acinetobacter baumannii]
MRLTRDVMAPLALALSCAPVAAVAQQSELVQPPQTAEALTARSPDGSLEVSVRVDNDGRPTYSLTRRGKL